jgi:flavin-dependent dehydrogenase
MAGQSKPPHVVIIGAGIGGLFLAQFLRKQSVSFDVFERDTSASARGQGFALGLHMYAPLVVATWPIPYLFTLFQS